MASTPSLDYFESDQVRYAVMLWRLLRKAGVGDFDVLRFGRDWAYAEITLTQCLQCEQEAVVDAALDLIQQRARFAHQEPARARKLGASEEVPNGDNAVPEAIRAPTSPVAPKHPDPSDKPKYVKSLR